MRKCDEVFKEIYEIWESREKGYKYKCTSILYDFLSSIIVPNSPTQNYLKIARSIQYMETNLDKIAEEGIEWQNIIKEFYTDFAKELVVAEKDSVKIKIAPKPTDEVCEKCGSPMVIRTGKFGEFLACSNYPTCKNVVSMNKPKEVSKCPKCGKTTYCKKRLTK